MLSQIKWARTSLVALTVVALLSGGFAWAGKPPKDPEPEPVDPTYSVDWIEPLLGHNSLWLHDINNLGEAVGVSSVRSDYGIADPLTFAAVHYTWNADGELVLKDMNELLLDPNVDSDFAAEEGYVLAVAAGINEYGQIAGSAWIPESDSTIRPFRYTPGIMGDEGNWVMKPRIENLGLPEASAVVACEANCINDFGDVAGDCRDAAGYMNGGYLYTDRDFDGDELPDGFHVFPEGNLESVNDSALVVGSHYTPESDYRAFYYEPAIGSDYIESDSAYGVYCRDVNNDGLSVGSGWFVTTVQINKNKTETVEEFCCFRHDILTGTLENIGEMPGSIWNDAIGINSDGVIVGRAKFFIDRSYAFVPFIYSDDLGFQNPDELAGCTLSPQQRMGIIRCFDFR